MTDLTPTLRVCHLGKYYPPAPGGIETNVRILARAQADLGHKVRVLCVNHRRGATIDEVDGPVAVTRSARTFEVDKLDICPGLSATLANVEADILHLHVPNPTMILALLRARHPAPVVVTYQSDVIRQRIREFFFRPLERLAYRGVRVIAQTSPLYAAGSRFLRPYAERLDLLPNGIDLQPYLDPLPEHRLAAERIKATYPGPLWLGCGRLVYYKGFPMAIRALAHVSGTLLLVGGGPLRAMLEAEATRLGVRDRVVFLGKLPHYLDIVPYYLAADAFWFPSNARSEGFGIVQVEAMASGCPVINAAIPHSGVAWVSRHEREGLTVPMNDPQRFAAAARRLVEEPGLRDRLASAARARAVAEFDHIAMAHRSIEIYHRALYGDARCVAQPEPIPAYAGP
ncbi:MAG: glycosyl transferase group 1 [Planctomycetota bacterium]|nr:glycosyl transferase group 1 [Planctomycetota bacterium]